MSKSAVLPLGQPTESLFISCSHSVFRKIIFLRTNTFLHVQHVSVKYFWKSTVFILMSDLTSVSHCLTCSPGSRGRTGSSHWAHAAASPAAGEALRRGRGGGPAPIHRVFVIKVLVCREHKQIDQCFIKIFSLLYSQSRKQVIINLLWNRSKPITMELQKYVLEIDSLWVVWITSRMCFLGLTHSHKCIRW